MAGLGNADLMLVVELDGAVVRVPACMRSAHVRRRHAMGLGMSVTLAAQGQGVGSALMAALCNYADARVGLKRIELTVCTDNARAVRPYQRSGLVIEGILKGYALREGRYVDAYAMARLHRAPPVIG